MPVSARLHAVGINHAFNPIRKSAHGVKKLPCGVIPANLLADSSLTLAVVHVQTWMRPECVPSFGDVCQLLECIRRLISIMKYSFERLIWPIVIYAECFVRRVGQIDESQLFPLLVVAAVVAMKMWEDMGPDLALASFVTGLSKKHICTLERALLEKLNFSLCLDDAFIEDFKSAPLLIVDPLRRRCAFANPNPRFSVTTVDYLASVALYRWRTTAVMMTAH